MQLTEKSPEGQSKEYFEISWRDAIRCPWCGQDPFKNLSFTKDLKCQSCGEKVDTQSNVVTWAKSEVCGDGVGTIQKPRISVSRAFDLLSRALNPIANPLLPFRHILNLRTRQYYKRTIFDKQLAEEWASHYLSGLNLQMNATVLDHGCGKGRNVGLLTQLGFNVSAQDIKPDFWWNHFPFCKFQTLPSSASRLPWVDASFDLVLDFGVLGLFPHEKIDELYREVRRVLKPKGYWLILEANDESYGQHGFQQLTLPLHIARSVCRKTGFSEIDFSYEGFYSPVFPQLVNFFRKACAPWRMNIADFDSWLAKRIPVKKRGLWLLRLQRD